ncbi:gamma carbonic anhydrase family protein [Pseudobacteriovorax antillogorgiicola]|uniref:Carbonic anhydrase or acetyltransferase, isoleucine patch superfamily n=1 Tax=Pseudobacteriovorax antillogorgiicola TaxID=1513793 RepID=A0A1Y6BPI4_9BACT|nr:gamma carbonic anhydrase family protein [Pseudobacteriovorax antillogorgiicola]TCS53849.1 carbonic anhydrase/acetyltransferase-like protein (isoleucine patch superfamily) [Pseudobacteriovorax antillogorgiicola]SMF21589.1 Carbonic anhydrase or acetyltransferase, isoleucine patch superfamily [Pseudobacteriovorax antillogorgiicola]
MYLMPGSNLLPYKGKTPKLAEGVFAASGAQLIGDLEVGRDSSFWFNTVARGDCYYIRIGERSNVQDGTVIHVTNSKHASIIGDDVTIGHGAVIHGCEIGNGCLVGMGAIIMDGAKIGERCLIGAGTLVPPGKSYPPESLIKGTPGKAVRALTDDELKFLKTSVDYYLDYKSHYVPHS